MSYQDIKSFEQESREKSEEIERLKSLITQLADALDAIREAQNGLHFGEGSLIHRARDAVK